MVFGDSNVRALYKDAIWLLEKNSLIHLPSLRGKILDSFIHKLFPHISRGLQTTANDSIKSTHKLTSGNTPLEPVLFMEKLYVFDENGKKIGRFSLNVDQGQEDWDNKPFYVHISNRAFVGGKMSESIVTGTVTRRLKTMEEIRYECTEMSSTEKHERTMFLLRESTKYYLSVKKSICDLKHHKVTTLTFNEAIGLIGECGNAVLMRILAFQGYEGILCHKTILSNGKLCRNYYVTKLSKQMVNGEKMNVLVIYRTITNHKKCNVTMTMALTRAGQLIYLFWSNSKCFLHVNPDVKINPRQFTYAGDSELCKHWHQDVQLHSIYLDRVDQNLISYRSYRYYSEPLTRILSDFIEFVILNKPKDVVCFAIQYFTAFGHGSFQRCSSKLTVPEDFLDEEKTRDEEPLWHEEGLYSRPSSSRQSW